MTLHQPVGGTAWAENYGEVAGLTHLDCPFWQSIPAAARFQGAAGRSQGAAGQPEGGKCATGGRKRAIGGRPGPARWGAEKLLELIEKYIKGPARADPDMFNSRDYWK